MKGDDTLKRFLCLLLGCGAILLSFLHAGAAPQALCWYTKRNDRHEQPQIPSEFGFVEKYGFFVDRARGDTATEKVLYLTFDAGYENGNVEKILDVLERTQTTGAFFLLSHFVKSRPDLVCRMQRAGHLVCNHTASHKNLSFADSKTVAQEIGALEAACEEIGVKTAPYFRPPEGKFSEELLKNVSDLGYKSVFWSFAYADWDNQKQPDPAKALRLVTDHFHNGEILLLHPTSATNAEILEQVIKFAVEQGYRFGSLSEISIGV